MRIDIHTHTKKIKSGDALTRNVTADRFGEIIKNTDVKILAVTNHNHFDLGQFNELQDSVSGSCQLWPGIELDIIERSKRSHLIVIANPKKIAEFDKRVHTIVNGSNPDTFTISLVDTVRAFDDLDCIYIAHYFVKKPSLDDEGINVLTGLVSNPKRILKEATNPISCGIYISHGHNSIYGSDVQN